MARIDSEGNGADILAKGVDNTDEVAVNLHACFVLNPTYATSITNRSFVTHVTAAIKNSHGDTVGPTPVVADDERLNLLCIDDDYSKNHVAAPTNNQTLDESGSAGAFSRRNLSSTINYQNNNIAFASDNASKNHYIENDQYFEITQMLRKMTLSLTITSIESRLSQLQSIDYCGSFSPANRHEGVGVPPAVAASRPIKLHQRDVTTASFHGDFEAEFYNADQRGAILYAASDSDIMWAGRVHTQSADLHKTKSTDETMLVNILGDVPFAETSGSTALVFVAKGPFKRLKQKRMIGYLCHKKGYLAREWIALLPVSAGSSVRADASAVVADLGVPNNHQHNEDIRDTIDLLNEIGSVIHLNNGSVKYVQYASDDSNIISISLFDYNDEGRNGPDHNELDSRHSVGSADGPAQVAKDNTGVESEMDYFALTKRVLQEEIDGIENEFECFTTEFNNTNPINLMLNYKPPFFNSSASQLICAEADLFTFSNPYSDPIAEIGGTILDPSVIGTVMLLNDQSLMYFLNSMDDGIKHEMSAPYEDPSFPAAEQAFPVGVEVTPTAAGAMRRNVSTATKLNDKATAIASDDTSKDNSKGDE
ncbi:uncharacterized protein ASCRUDRAFT_10605 [Ascoidea rubescens DSM 1968]|uniref:Uncharacterized protein n=1 Tax=Ascoidea rubescens DSM 1968 TaxID=1344418 RepID=A0A1D2V8Q6_9ASCO|nr:hypothetical protein ASCRUDRAFT_10605 [Ascoidea rubescens DSM 1968]ODV57998.1 hypothetical protein ASCRUDRAFT_10605 [Ascoidea rubescens DSM 1968]